MGRIKIFITFSAGFLLSGCGCHYDINRQYFEYSCRFKGGFQFEKISVDSFNIDGIPISYQADTIVKCMIRGDAELSQELQRINDSLGIDLPKYGFKFKPANRIYFFKENKYYEWIYFKPYNPSIALKTFPLKFKTNQWYHIRGLASGDGNQNYELFIRVDSREELRVFHYYKPGPY